MGQSADLVAGIIDNTTVLLYDPETYECVGIPADLFAELTAVMGSTRVHA